MYYTTMNGETVERPEFTMQNNRMFWEVADADREVKLIHTVRGIGYVMKVE